MGIERVENRNKRDECGGSGHNEVTKIDSLMVFEMYDYDVIGK